MIYCYLFHTTQTISQHSLLKFTATHLPSVLSVIRTDTSLHHHAVWVCISKVRQTKTELFQLWGGGILLFDGYAELNIGCLVTE